MKLCGRCNKPKGEKEGCCNCGRPPKYKGEETCKQVDEYLAKCQDTEIQVIKYSGERGDQYENKLKVNLPTLNGLALHIGVNVDTLREWGKEYPEFSASLRKVLNEQEKRLLDNGLAGTYNSTIAKLVLSSNHGYKEREDHTTNDKDLPVISKEELSQLFNQYGSKHPKGRA